MLLQGALVKNMPRISSLNLLYAKSDSFERVVLLDPVQYTGSRVIAEDSHMNTGPHDTFSSSHLRQQIIYQDSVSLLLRNGVDW